MNEIQLSEGGREMTIQADSGHLSVVVTHTERKLHERHLSAFRVQKKGSGKYKPWTVHWPTDPTSDYPQQMWFTTFREAIYAAQREAFKSALLADFENYLESNQNTTVSSDYDHTGLDTMYRVFEWWGKYDLPGFLENI